MKGSIEGPAESRTVQARLGRTIPFDNLTPDQRELRAELRSRIGRLTAGPNEVLHATFAGPRHPGSDVENLLLYNVDMDGGCFRANAAHGLRFELGQAGIDQAPDAGSSCSYTYRLSQRDAGFLNWAPVRVLARFEHVGDRYRDVATFEISTNRRSRTSEPRHW